MTTSEAEDALRLHQLSTAKEQGWVTAVAEAVQRQHIDELDSLVSQGSADFALLTGGATVREAAADEFSQFDDADPRPRAARAIVNVGRALLDPRGREAMIRDALQSFSENGAVSVTQDIPQDVEKQAWSVSDAPQLNSLLGVLADLSNEPSAGFAALMALHLWGQLPEEDGRAAMVPVLFDTEAGSLGRSGHLRMVRLKNGPPGLHPDPRRMGFTLNDDDFTRALAAAWETVPSSQRDSCVVWSLLDGDDSILEVRGGSLGAAFAVALDELAPRTRWRRLLRGRVLDPNCAVTGQLSDGSVLPVNGYEAKLQAALRRSWRVVVPQDSIPEVMELRLKIDESLSVRGAHTVGEAITAARSRPNKQLVIAILLAAVLLLGGTTGAVWVSNVLGEELQQQRSQRVAAGLATESLSLLDRDPRMAALTALAGYEIAPSLAGAASLAKVSDANAAVVKTLQAHEAEVYSIAMTDESIITTDRDGVLAAWTLDLEESDRVELDMSLVSVNASADGKFVFASGLDESVLFSLKGGTLTEWSRWKSGSRGGMFDQNGERIINIENNTEVVWTGLDGIVLDRVNLDELEGISTVWNQRLWVKAMVTVPCSTVGVADVGDGQGCLLFALNSGDLQAYVPGSDAVVTVASRSDLPAAPTSIAIDRSGRMLVGTEKGAYRLWASMDKASFEGLQPIGGVTEHVHDLTVTQDGDVVLLTGRALEGDTAVWVNVATGEPVSRSRATVLSHQNFGPLSQDSNGASDEPEAVVAAGSFDGTVSLLGKTRDRVALPPAPGATAVTFTPEGDLLLAPGGGINNMSWELSLLKMSPPDMAQREVIRRFQVEDNGAWYVNKIVATEHLFVAGGTTGTSALIAIWDRGTGKLLHSITSHERYMETAMYTSVAVSKDERRVMAYNLGAGELEVWGIDPEDADVKPRRIAQRPAGGVGEVEYHAESDTFYAISWVEQDDAYANNGENLLTAVDPTSGSVLWELPAGDAYRLSARASGGMFALLHPERIELRELDGETVVRDRKVSEPMDDVEWSPDGSKLATLSETGRVYLFDGDTLLPTMPPIDSADLDGDILARIAWSPDGTLIASNSLTKNEGLNRVGSTLLFRPATSEWEARMCAIAGSPMSAEEWLETVGPDIPYRELCVPASPGEKP